MGKKYEFGWLQGTIEPESEDVQLIQDLIGASTTTQPIAEILVPHMNVLFYHPRYLSFLCLGVSLINEHFDILREKNKIASLPPDSLTRGDFIRYISFYEYFLTHTLVGEHYIGNDIVKKKPYQSSVRKKIDDESFKLAQLKKRFLKSIYPYERHKNTLYLTGLVEERPESDDRITELGTRLKEYLLEDRKVKNFSDYFRENVLRGEREEIKIFSKIKLSLDGLKGAEKYFLRELIVDEKHKIRDRLSIDESAGDIKTTLKIKKTVLGKHSLEELRDRLLSDKWRDKGVEEFLKVDIKGKIPDLKWEAGEIKNLEDILEWARMLYQIIHPIIKTISDVHEQIKNHEKSDGNRQKYMGLSEISNLMSESWEKEDENPLEEGYKVFKKLRPHMEDAKGFIRSVSNSPGKTDAFWKFIQDFYEKMDVRKKQQVFKEQLEVLSTRMKEAKGLEQEPWDIINGKIRVSREFEKKGGETPRYATLFRLATFKDAVKRLE